MLCTSVLIVLLQLGLVRAGIKLPPEPSDKSTPVQQRLSFHGPSSVAVAWNTYVQLSQACVQYGTDKNLSQTQCSSQSVTYSTSRTWSNLVILPDLQPATKYYYRIGSTNVTDVDYFLTARRAGDTTPFTMATYADLGVYGKDGFTTKKRDQIPGTDPVLNHSTIGQLAAQADNYEFIIHPGDFAYADDWVYDVTNYLDSKNAYTAIIETFYSQLAPVSARKPYMVSPGNHEAQCEEVPVLNRLCPAGQSNFSDFQNRYSGMMPTAFSLAAGSNSTAAAARENAKSLAQPPFWYSFDYGMAHIVMIDTETDFADAPDGPGGSAHLDGGPFGAPNQQLEFLDADLSSVDRTVTPWVVVAGHRPWYTNGKSGTPCGSCQAAFEDIIFKYGVDLAAFGHVHNMQRFLPIYNGTLDPNGLNNPKAPVYTIIGGAGNIEGHSDITPQTTGNAFAYNDNFGFGTLTFHNRTHLEVNFISSVDGRTLDNSVLYKTHDDAFVVQS